MDSVKRTEATEVFYKVDKIAEFPGGMGKFYEYISKNIRYPEDAIKEDMKGKVLVEFVIESTGDVRQDEVKIVQGFFKSCDEEAIRLVKQCPKWKPAYIKKLKKNVPMRMVIPITFKPE